MAQPISIIHFTDIHIRQSNLNDVKRRVSDFVAHARKNEITPDILIVSGDLTFSGLPEEFQMFDEVFLRPICEVLRVNPKKAILIPGNHDVDRNLVTAPELSARERVSRSRDMESSILNGKCKRLENFYSYLAAIDVRKGDKYITHPVAGGNADVKLIKVRGLQVGVACLNTAWLCADDHDKGRLLLTERQVSDAVDLVASSDLRIAVCHHPGDWLHSDEIELALKDLKREFDIVLSGHLHDPDSHYNIEPGIEHLWFVGRAFFDGKLTATVEDGFHLYNIDIPGKKVTAKYRKYIRTRGSFVADTSHADDGEYSFVLPASRRMFGSEAIIVQRLAEKGTSLQQEIRRELSLLQDTQDPIIVTPKICRIKFEGGRKKKSRQASSIQEILKENGVISGSADSGKTILLKGIAAEHQNGAIESESFGSADAHPTLYFRLPKRDVAWTSRELESLIREELSHSLSAGNEVIRLHLLADDVKVHVPENALAIHDLCVGNNWSYTIAISDDLACETVAKLPCFGETLFYEIQPWGPSKIKEMAVKIFENTGIDAELAFKCVKRTLAEYDLPANPTTVCLYFSLVAKSGGAVTGVSFLRLLEKIEETRIGVKEKPPANDRYHRRQLLYRFASRMLETSVDSIEIEEVTAIANEYLQARKLGSNSTDVMAFLEKSGIVVCDCGRLSFVNFVFLNYYIARGVADGVISEDSVSSDLTQCVCLAQSLALFAGMRRENLDLASKVLAWIQQRFPEPEKRELKDLDHHVKELLAPVYDDNSADSIVQEDLSRKHDHSVGDEQFESERKKSTSEKKALFSGKKSMELSELSALTNSLHSFYGILKNLEGIEGDRKVDFLDRILDFHIRTNFLLIDYFHSLVPGDDFRTIFAYVTTWSGHKFMAASLGSQALCDAAKDCVDKTENDFKELLLILLLSDLKDRDSLDLIRKFVQETESRSAVEIIFIHLRQRMIDHEAASIPTELVAVFRETFQKRQRCYTKRGDKQKENKLFDDILRDAKHQHVVVRNSGIIGK